MKFATLASLTALVTAIFTAPQPDISHFEGLDLYPRADPTVSTPGVQMSMQLAGAVISEPLKTDQGTYAEVTARTFASTHACFSSITWCNTNSYVLQNLWFPLNKTKILAMFRWELQSAIFQTIVLSWLVSIWEWPQKVKKTIQRFSLVVAISSSWLHW